MATVMAYEPHATGLTVVRADDPIPFGTDAGAKPWARPFGIVTEWGNIAA